MAEGGTPYDSTFSFAVRLCSAICYWCSLVVYIASHSRPLVSPIRALEVFNELSIDQETIVLFSGEAFGEEADFSAVMGEVCESSLEFPRAGMTRAGMTRVAACYRWRSWLSGQIIWRAL